VYLEANLEHPATRSSMPGDVRRCPADDQRRIRLGSFSVRMTSKRVVATCLTLHI
jgi:hypothetical protein